VYGGISPDTDALKVTELPTFVELGDALHETDKAGGIMVYEPPVAVPKSGVPKPSSKRTFSLPGTKSTFPVPMFLPVKLITKIDPADPL